MNRLRELLEDRQKLICFARDNRDMLIKVAAVAVLIIAAFFVFVQGKADEKPAESETDIVASAPEKEKLYVDIGGEVVNPMVAELDEGSRVEDAIEAAGGLTENADISQINRAAFIEDGEKIFVPSILVSEEADGLYGSAGSAAAYSDGKININTADSLQLQELNGVGPATAEKIISYREENGRFKSIEDIKNVSGIGDKIFEKLRDEIKV